MLGCRRSAGRLRGPTSAARTAAEVVFIASQGWERFQEQLDWQFANVAEVAALWLLRINQIGFGWQLLAIIYLLICYEEFCLVNTADGRSSSVM